MVTAFKALGVLSLASAKPKSDAENVLLPSSNTVRVESLPVGASFTLVTGAEVAALAMLSIFPLPSV